MVRGRPPTGPALVEHFDGSAPTKARLQIVLQTIAGEKTVAEACGELGISPARFHEIRSAALEAALRSLELRPAGRPPHRPDAKDQLIAQLEQQVAELRIELKAAQVREEIALVMPHLLQPPEPALKKTRRQAPRVSQNTPRQSGARRDAT